VLNIFYLIVFPGFLSLFVFSLLCEYVDRKVTARLQSRVGPPFYQPWADFIKLISKEDLVPEKADRKVFTAIPIFGVAAVVTAFIYIPLWSTQSLFPFTGDIVVVIYLLSLPTLLLFLAGWYSTNVFGTIGAIRGITQLFGYEVPFLLALLSPALVSGIWSLSGILNYQVEHAWFIAYLPLSFIVAVIALAGKLERTPFDIPHAAQEITGGPFTEYSGPRLALMHLMLDMELFVGSALIAALFLGGFHYIGMIPGITGPIVGFIVFLIKTLIVLFILIFIKVAFARIKIDQLINMSLKWLAPMALIQLLITVGLKVSAIL
jgi:NADH-quinone oxidoreductase subunit H